MKKFFLIFLCLILINNLSAGIYSDEDSFEITTTTYDTNITNLDDILDVNAPTPSDEDFLRYDSGTSKWIAESVAGFSDTNETTRFNQLTGNCTTGYVMKGVNEDGSRVCVEDNTTAGGENNILTDNLYNASELEEQGDGDLGIVDSFIQGLIEAYGYITSTYFDQDLNTTSHVEFASINSSDWSNVSITEGQISDLDHYTDADIDGSETAFDGWDKDASNDFTNITNFTGTLTDTKYCTYDSAGEQIVCNSEGGVTTYYNGTGIEINASNNISIVLSYQVPQGCNDGEIAEYNTTSGGWDCGVDNTASSGMSNWVIAADDTAGSSTITDGETVTFNDDNAYINATRSGDNIVISLYETKLNSTIDSRISLQGLVNFSGSWNDLTNIPAGFDDDVDNDTTYTHLSNFTDDVFDNSTIARIGDCPSGQFVQNTTTGGVECLEPTLSESDPLWSANQTNYFNKTDILAFGYYNSTDFVITDYFTKAEILGFNYYNSTDFDIADYFTSAEVLAFNYYNATDFDINDYVTLATLLGFNYYNSTDFDINDYYTKSEIDGFNYYNATDFDINNYYTKAEINSFNYYNSTNPPPGSYNTTEDMQDAIGSSFNGSLSYDDPNNIIYANKSWFDSIYALIGDVFSGSWNDLTDVPAGFADGVDNDTAEGLTHLSNFTNDLGFYNESTINSSELEHQGDGNLGILDSFIEGLIDNRVTQAFVESLGFYTETEINNFDYYNNSNFPYTHQSNFTDDTDYSTKNTNSSNYWDGLNTPTDINTADLTDDNTYVEVSGDTMSGNLNISNANLTITEDSFMCLSQDCISNMSFNGTHTIWY